MIRPLRRRHRWTIVLLTALVPAGFGLSIAARPDYPGGSVETLATDERLLPLGDLPLGGRIVDGARLELFPTADLKRPDVLVYLTAEVGPFDSLPDDVELLGGLSGLQPRIFALGERARDGVAMSLVLYSLGHQEVLGSAPLPIGD